MVKGLCPKHEVRRNPRGEVFALISREQRTKRAALLVLERKHSTGVQTDIITIALDTWKTWEEMSNYQNVITITESIRERAYHLLNI